MVISAYQVNNVLRVYHDQLRHGKVSSRPANNMTRSPDQVSISTGGKQKALMDKISSGIAEKINKYGMRNETGKDAYVKFENEFGVQPDVSQNSSSDMI